MSDVTAALLLAQLESVRAITAAAAGALGRLPLRRSSRWSATGSPLRPRFTAGSEHNGHIYYLMLPDRAQRDELIARLRSAGIHAYFHYVPLHSSPAGRRFGRAHGRAAAHRRRRRAPDPAAPLGGHDRGRRRAGLRGGGVRGAVTGQPRRWRPRAWSESRRVWVAVIAVGVVLTAILLVELARPRDFLTGTNSAGSDGAIVHVDPGQRLCLHGLEIPAGTGRLQLRLRSPGATTLVAEVDAGGGPVERRQPPWRHRAAVRKPPRRRSTCPRERRARHGRALRQPVWADRSGRPSRAGVRTARAPARRQADGCPGGRLVPPAARRAQEPARADARHVRPCRALPPGRRRSMDLRA